MSGKKTNSRALDLKQAQDRTNLAERQTEDHALLGAAQAAEMAGYTKDFAQVNQLLGQVEAFSGIAKLTTVVGLLKLKHIKENKLYRALSENSGGAKPKTVVGTWDGFCRRLGTSANKVNEDLNNLETFGAEALEGLQQIGAGYRELRRLRKLPDEERELIINGEVLQAGDKESLVDLIEEMAAKHATEKDALEARADGLDKDLAASRRKNENQNRKIDELTQRLDQALSPGDWPKLVEKTNVQTQIAAGKALEACDQLDRLRDQILTGDLEGRSDDEAESLIESMAVAYYDQLTHLWGRVGELMESAEEVFAGYKARVDERAANAPDSEA